MKPLSLAPLIRLVLPFAEAAVVTLLAALGGRVIADHFDVPNVSLVFLIPVLAAAVRHGFAASLCAATLSVLSFDYFFLPPLYRLTISDPADVTALFFLVIVALVTSALAARAHAEALAAARRARTLSTLHDLSNAIAGVLDLDALLDAAGRRMAQALNAEVVFLMPDNGALAARAAIPSGVRLEPADLAAAQRSWTYGGRAGGVNDPTTPSRRWFVPMHTGRSDVGVVGVLLTEAPDGLSAPDRDLFQAMASQVAVAIERVALATDIDKARLGAERERLRSAMLTSVSHDLRTPLASIVGVLSSLRSHRDRYDDAARQELLTTALGEAERLDRFVGNLLDMTRLDAGVIVPHRESVDVGDLVSTTLRRAAPLVRGRVVSSAVAPDLPMLHIDFVLAEQMLFNLLDNAVKYSPADGLIEVEARSVGDRIEIVVRDEGGGIAPAALERLFDKFYRADEGDRRRAGTGLGLAIAKGFVEVEGGSIMARNRTDRGGAEFIVSYRTAP
ncbi:MAG: DUF4118 domain-containing protein [Proteobacteria bacterium]|nr:DUF4118 domain-containing protein [Pseudomonadota bacterium]